jgi:hypothetical protein
VSKNAGESGWTYLVVIVVLLIGASWLRETFWGEREGTIKTEDCRARVLIKADSPTTWFKQFTCMYRKSQKGTLISGLCEAVETSGAVCETVYYYEKPVPHLCNDPKYPYLGMDELCYSTPQ